MRHEEVQPLIEDFRSSFEADMRRARVRAMVMGPSRRSRRDDATEAARALRKAIVKHCNDHDVAVEPELRHLVAVSEEALGGAHNLCIYELRLAKRCDLIVIVAASAGPLVELGMFAERRFLRTRSVLVLLDHRYKQFDSFINHGPRKAYQRIKAHIVDVDYERPEHVQDVLAIVGSLIEDERANKLANRF